jgi:hypothetical protein
MAIVVRRMPLTVNTREPIGRMTLLGEVSFSKRRINVMPHLPSGSARANITGKPITITEKVILSPFETLRSPYGLNTVIPHLVSIAQDD